MSKISSIFRLHSKRATYFEYSGCKSATGLRQPRNGLSFLVNKEMERIVETAQQPANQKPKNYVRQQKGHSLALHIALCLVMVGFFTIPYYTISPNHYWHF